MSERVNKVTQQNFMEKNTRGTHTTQHNAQHNIYTTTTTHTHTHTHTQDNTLTHTKQSSKRASKHNDCRTNTANIKQTNPLTHSLTRPVRRLNKTAQE